MVLCALNQFILLQFYNVGLSTSGAHQIRCMVTLLADHICEADLTLRVHKQQSGSIQAKIYPDIPWRLQQIQDAGNHLQMALGIVEGRDDDHVFRSGQEVCLLFDSIIECLQRGRSCLALPKKRTIEELVRNPFMKSLKPPLPNDTLISFYVQAQKLVLAVYSLYVNPAQKIDIHTRYQVECSVPWLNDTLVLFTLAIQQCQQLRDKMTVFMQYEAETKFLDTKRLTLRPYIDCPAPATAASMDEPEDQTSCVTSQRLSSARGACPAARPDGDLLTCAASTALRNSSLENKALLSSAKAPPIPPRNKAIPAQGPLIDL